MENTCGLKSYGLGLTQLRKLAKTIGRNHQLALECWQSDYYDLRVIGLLIDEPKKITVEQAENQVESLSAGMLTHVFSFCDATLAKSAIAFDMAVRWQNSDSLPRKISAYGLLYELSKNKRDSRLNDEFFLTTISQINQTIDNEPKAVRLSMGTALMGIGKRNLTLNKAAIDVAKRIGAIDFNEGGSKCEPFDILKHLTSDYLKQKFAS
ncbi:DNA alkylation repair protein [Aliiglaciecola litoralis]|uniref:Uncharacterized protein n=1 Tax=Aliiglaciecola litoralis TaxID=582857 RepID=A0ABP3WQQ3_9ALTE